MHADDASKAEDKISGHHISEFNFKFLIQFVWIFSGKLVCVCVCVETTILFPFWVTKNSLCSTNRF